MMGTSHRTDPAIHIQTAHIDIMMNNRRSDTSYTIKGAEDFDPVHTFECGQCFRWDRQEDGSYEGVAMGRIVNIRYDAEDFDPGAGSLTMTPCTEREFRDIWYDYFDFGRDYGPIKECLSANDATMRQAIRYGYGIRLLKQDLWETIVSFIISQNNNIPRIKGCIERLCDNFGEPVGEDASGKLRYDIPSAEKLAELEIEDLAPVRLGYRAKYIIETARTVCAEGLPENFEQLSSLCGVGPKVASCISLFGMQDYASFPIDVWVMKVMHELYGIPEKDKKAMAEFASEKFGSLGGFAQQYLFYYMRDRKG